MQMPRRTWEENNMDIEELSHEDVDRIQRAQD
jgi:hypothetical protein